MLLQESRHAARNSPTEGLILLENQNRSLWDPDQIAVEAVTALRVLSVLTDRDPEAHAPGSMLSCATRTYC